MQSAKTVLGVLRERGRHGLPCDELYRQLFNPQLYLLAYGRIYANHGAMTPGVTSETVDGMSQRKIDGIIEAMRHERYRFRPVRRVHIPKKRGKTRPLGLPTWSDKLVGEKARRRGDRVQARALRQRMVSLPSADPKDPGYRRLRYIRYADDHLLGFTGPKAEAEQIKQRLGQFLRDELKLELSQEETLITHARTRAARFLGYEITTQHNDTKKTGRYRRVNGQVALRVPRDVIKAKCAPYIDRGKPAKKTALINSSDHAIVATFGTVYRGVVQYYLLAGDVFRLHRLQWVMETSMLKTLAAKHRSSVSKMAAKHKARIDTPNGPRVCFEARIERKNRTPLVARFGGIPLQRQRAAELADREPVRVDYPQKELIARLLADTCEICGSKGNVQVHHVRALADLAHAGWQPSDWARVMLHRRRKTVVACDICHDRIHSERPARPFTQ